MKKLLTLLLAATTLFALFSLPVLATGKTLPTVSVTIADENGNLVLLYQTVAYTEGMTVDDALRKAHEGYFDDGYASEKTAYGLSMTKLWNVENGGGYGYMVNHESVNSLADPVKEDDHIYAYMYTDTKSFSDTYSFFTEDYYEVKTDGTVTLTLKKAVFDENFTLQHEPVEGAIITIDGKDTAFVTDKDGKATVSCTKLGSHVLSARSDKMTLVPPAALLYVDGYTYISIVDEKGEFVLAREPISVSDMDNDRLLTVNDALLTAHDLFCKDGYAVDKNHGNPQITKLWGIADRAYGCYIDDGLVYRLDEMLSNENHIQAVIYAKDTTDAFTYFSKDTLTFENGKETVTLYMYEMTEDGNYMTKPLSGAEITVNGEKIGVKTDKNGKFTLTLSDLEADKNNVISAQASKMTIVPPVLTYNTQNKEIPAPAPISPAVWVAVAIAFSIAAIFVIRAVVYKRKKA